MRFYGGGQYARLQNSTTLDANAQLSADTLLTVIPSSSTHLYVTQQSTYNGFGPRIGVDLSRALAYNVSIYTKGATAILAGTSNSKITSLFLHNPVSTGTNHAAFVIPEFEAKLGAAYDYKSANGILKLDAGWMWISYLNLNGINQLSQPSLSLEGPYFGLKWIGQAA